MISFHRGVAGLFHPAAGIFSYSHNDSRTVVALLEQWQRGAEGSYGTGWCRQSFHTAHARLCFVALRALPRLLQRS